MSTPLPPFPPFPLPLLPALTQHPSFCRRGGRERKRERGGRERGHFWRRIKGTLKFRPLSSNPDSRVLSIFRFFSFAHPSYYHFLAMAVEGIVRGSSSSFFSQIRTEREMGYSPSRKKGKGKRVERDGAAVLSVQCRGQRKKEESGENTFFFPLDHELKQSPS